MTAAPATRLPLTGLDGFKVLLSELITDDVECFEFDRKTGQCQVTWRNERGEREEFWFELHEGEAPFLSE